MSEKPSTYNTASFQPNLHLIETYRLQHSSADTVYAWLEDHSLITPNEARTSPSRRQLEEALLAREHPLINLGLAQFCWTPSVARRLFTGANYDIAVRVAVATSPAIGLDLDGNPWVLPCILRVMEQEESAVLQAMLGNAHLPDVVLLAFVERSGVFAHIADAEWLGLLASLGNNARLHSPVSAPWDGYAEYQYNKLVETFWSLFETVPVSAESASILSAIGNFAVPLAPPSMDIDATMVRWGDTQETSSSLFLVRATLARLMLLMPHLRDTMPEHSDLAVRYAYYLHEPMSIGELDLYHGRDGKAFSEAAISNHTLYAQPDTLDWLQARCAEETDPTQSALRWQRFEDIGKDASDRPAPTITESWHSPPQEAPSTFKWLAFALTGGIAAMALALSIFWGD